MNLDNINNKIEDRSLTVAVFGLGRIGLPTALMFTKGEYNVIGIDINDSLLEDLQKKNTFIDEPGLPKLLEEAVDQKRIQFTTDYQLAIKNAQVMIICVPTPVNEHKIPDYSAIKDVARKIGQTIKPGQIIIIESSVSPTTIDTIIIPILEEESGFKLNNDFGVCSCPERADPGKIVDNFNKVARIVGASSDDIGKSIVSLYKTITEAEIVQVSTPGTANAVKLTENIFRDVNIALMNEFAVLYDRLGIDIKEVIKGSSTKYNFQPHYPGPGVGGPCLPANPYYIIEDAEKVDYIPFLIRVSREINDRMPKYIVELVTKALNYVGKSVKGSKIGVLGISYKANVRDIQISPSLKVIDYLTEQNASIFIWDPFYAGETVQKYSITHNLEEAIQEVDCVVLLTDHKEFLELDFNKLLPIINKQLVLVDGRNVYNPKQLPENSIYCGVGRKLQKIN
jgi:nucleotide sugar dehydrogenase